jgi:hypothetical protein
MLNFTQFQEFSWFFNDFAGPFRPSCGAKVGPGLGRTGPKVIG